MSCSSEEVSFGEENYIIGRIMLSHSNIIDDFGDAVIFNDNDIDLKKTINNYASNLQSSIDCLKKITETLSDDELSSLKLECKGFRAIIYGNDDAIMKLYEKGLVSIDEDNDIEPITSSDDSDSESDDDSDDDSNDDSESDDDSDDDSSSNNEYDF